MSGEKNILAADIGASKTNLGIFSVNASPLIPIRESTLITRDYANATDLLQSFLEKHPLEIDSACIGVPGPVLDNQSTTTNLPWLINGDELAGKSGIKKIRLVNDLEGTAASVVLLREEDLYQLNKGRRRDGANRAVIAPGTGLGEAFLCKNPAAEKFISYPSEGGHCDFAPANSLELALLAHLQKEIGHVSYELVCSGLGIVNIYGFIKESNLEREPDWLLKMFDESADPSRVIIAVAMAKEKSYPPCRKTLEIFVDILGAEAGNLALTVMALGGVYIGGGIPPRIVELLDSKIFLKTFLNKGRMASLLNDVPVYVIMNPKAPMIGAASLAISAIGAA
jgi:glucokinase